MSATTQKIIPYLTYGDAPKAIAFLTSAFGFKERFRYPMDNGLIGHAELELGSDNIIMLASEFEGFGQSPLKLPAVHSFTYCFVDDADAHCRTAKAAGATIIAEPLNDHGTRFYRALDLEGHRWIFAMPLKENASS